MNKWEEKRREEIIWEYSRLYDFVKHDDRLNRLTDKIVSQEKEMIDEAVKEFAKEVYKKWDFELGKYFLKIIINKLLKDRRIKEI